MQDGAVDRIVCDDSVAGVANSNSVCCAAVFLRLQPQANSSAWNKIGTISIDGTGIDSGKLPTRFNGVTSGK